MPTRPFYGTLGYSRPPPGTSETDIDLWRTAGQTNPAYSDWVTLGGQNYKRFGDPGALTNSWAPQGLESQLIYDPTYGYLLPQEANAQYEAPIQAMSAADDRASMAHWLGGAAAFAAPYAASMGFIGPGAGTIGASGGAFPVGAEGAAFGGIGEAAGAASSWGVNPRGEEGMDFFDDILEWGTDEESLVNGWGTNELDLPGGNSGELPSGFGQSSWFNSLINGLTPSPSTASTLARLFMGTNAQGETRGLGDLFGSSGLLGTAASVGPSLAAISYARGLPDPDTSRLESAYSSISPSSLAMPYDIQTGRGRESLDSSLTRRGVMGSSFANQDIESYDTLRGLGRSNLLTSGATSQANIAKQILDAQTAAQRNRTDLYGNALLALSGGLYPRAAGAAAGAIR